MMQVVSAKEPVTTTFTVLSSVAKTVPDEPPIIKPKFPEDIPVKLLNFNPDTISVSPLAKLFVTSIKAVLESGSKNCS